MKNLIQGIKNAIRLRREKEERKFWGQMRFVYQKAFNYQMTILPTKKISDLDIPEFLYEKQRTEEAQNRAIQCMFIKLVDRKVLNRLCKI